MFALAATPPKSGAAFVRLPATRRLAFAAGSGGHARVGLSRPSPAVKAAAWCSAGSSGPPLLHPPERWPRPLAVARPGCTMWNQA